jgi:uncharacterized protein YutE (UPF0331/DUF86 family)
LKTKEYQAETERSARETAILLEEVRIRLENDDILSLLEQRGVLHSVQLLIESAIGKAKRKLKSSKQTIPVSGYDTFEILAQNKEISDRDLTFWKKAIGLRNAIVHEYQNINWADVELIIKENRIQFVIDFLKEAF